MDINEPNGSLRAGLAKAVGAQHAIAVSSGTAALHLAMIGCNIEPDDEVIVPSLTFVATANAARYVGAKVVFADVCSEQNLTIDPEAIEQLITSRTKAIIVMHYAGFPCDMASIMNVAARNGISVIEDACHGLLSTLNGRALGTIGRAGCFSFFPEQKHDYGRRRHGCDERPGSCAAAHLCDLMP